LYKSPLSVYYVKRQIFQPIWAVLASTLFLEQQRFAAGASMYCM
jgi:hypothetical protein